MIAPSFPEVIDSSILSTFTNCGQLFFRTHVQHWKSTGSSIHLHAGKSYASGLETARMEYINGTPSREAIDAGYQRLSEVYGDFEADKEAKSKDRMQGALLYYFNQYPLETDIARIEVVAGIPGVEWSFALPLPIKHPDTGNPLIFSGRTDCLVRMAGGLYALDDKTTSSLGASWSKQWDLRGQFIGYAWAMRELGLKPAGSLVRGLSILKTKYDTQQAIISQPNWKIDRWYSQLLSKLTEMIEGYRTNSFRFALDESCNHYGGCSMKPVCQMSDGDSILETYYKQEVWHPLERH